MVAHTFKSEDHRAKHFEASSQLTLEYMRENMKNDSILPNELGQPRRNGYLLLRKAESAAILATLGPMADLYHNDIKEMPMIANVAD